MAHHALVREEMVKRQQGFAISGGVVMDGRDIGTHVSTECGGKSVFACDSGGKSLKTT